MKTNWRPLLAVGAAWLAACADDVPATGATLDAGHELSDSEAGIDPDAPATPCAELAIAAQEQLDEQFASCGFPGLVLGLYTPGCGTWIGASGFANLDQGVSLRADHVIPIGSVTKTFVAAVVLQLAEEGALQLEDPLSAWRPDITGAEQISVRHLLNHTSGLPDYLLDVDCWPARRSLESSPEDVLACVLEDEPSFAPGQGWGYSNTNYTLLGLIVEAVTGQSLHAQVTARLLEPLGLQRTGFEGEAAASLELARVYDGTEDVTGQWHPSYVWAVGDMVSSSGDMLTWLLRLFDGSVVSESTLGQMRDFVDGGSWGLGDYGLGLTRRAIEGPDGEIILEGHSGRWDGMAELYALPAHGSVVALQTNHRFTYGNVYRLNKALDSVVAKLSGRLDAH